MLTRKSPLLFFIFLLITTGFASGQDNQSINQETVNLYLDCRGCNESYIQQEINFVNFVRDMTDADVHLLITRQFASGGGREYTLKFIGQKWFSNQNDTLRYISYESDTEDIRRRGLTKRIKTGLLPYLSRTNIIRDLSITYEEEGRDQQREMTDNWNNWIFEVGLNAYFNGEESRENLFLSADAEAERVTENWKTRFNFYKNLNRRTFRDEDTTETFTTQTNRYWGLIAKSLDDHWSLGLFTEARTSTRNNYDLRIGGSPAIEFNIYPYSEYTEREFSFRYSLNTTYNNYDEITIFNKSEEILLQNSFSVNMEFTQPWGEIEGYFDANAYLHDMSKNRLTFDMEFDFQVTRGLSFRISGRYSLVNDQLNIPAEDISDEEQLLNLRAQSTSYFYRASIGFEYSFGSIYSSMVNPRF